MNKKRVFKTKSFARWAKKILSGREKSDSGTDFSQNEEAAAKLAGKLLHAATVIKLETMKTDGVLMEICGEQENKCE